MDKKGERGGKWGERDVEKGERGDMNVDMNGMGIYGEKWRVCEKRKVCGVGLISMGWEWEWGWGGLNEI